MEKPITESVFNLQKGPESIDVWVEDGQLIIQFPGADEPKRRLPPNVWMRLEIEALIPTNSRVTVTAYGSDGGKPLS